MFFTVESRKSRRGGFYAYMEYHFGDYECACFSSKHYEHEKDAKVNGFADCIEQCREFIKLLNKPIESFDDNDVSLWLTEYDED